MNSGTILLLISLLLSSLKAHAGNELEEMLDGFTRCVTTNVFLDPATGQVPHAYFYDRVPYKIESGFAYYKIEATYFGLPVGEIMIPASTWGVLALTFDMPIRKARPILKKELGYEFRRNKASAKGAAPELHADQANSGRSVLVCTNLQQ